LKYLANQIPIPGAKVVMIDELSDDELKINLYNQLVFLCGLLTRGTKQ